jgi:hypothetical protein
MQISGFKALQGGKTTKKPVSRRKKQKSRQGRLF